MKTPLRTPPLLVAVGALFLFAVVNLPASIADADGTRLLVVELRPLGGALRDARPEQVITATGRAVRREPKRTVGIVHAAILYQASRRPVESKNVVDRSKENPCPPCEFILKVVRAAIQANPGAASDVIEEASALCPSCAGDLQALLNDAGLALGGKEDLLSTVFGFGVGLGPSFPGAPGQSNDSVRGALALTPVGDPVTSVANK